MQLFKDKVKTWRCNKSQCQILLKIYCQCWLFLVCFSVTQSRHEAKLHRCKLQMAYMSFFS